MKKPIKKFPSFVKYKTYFKYKIKNKFSKFSGTFLKFGCVGFQSLHNFRITFREIEAMRRTIAFNHKQTKIWFRLELNVPISTKPISSRMGKGNGRIKFWTCNVKRGLIFLEFDCFECAYQIKKIIRLVRLKVSVNTRLVLRS